MAEISRYVYGTYHIPDLLRLQDQVPLISFVSLMMMAMKYFPRMCTPPQTLSTLTIQSLLQRVLPSSLTEHTTFLQTQVCVCVCMKSACVHMCAYMCVFMWMGRRAGRHVYILACMRVYIPICQGAYTTMHTCIVLTGVAVAAAFCPIESPAVTLPSEWLLGVTDIHTYVFCY